MAVALVKFGLRMLLIRRGRLRTERPSEETAISQRERSGTCAFQTLASVPLLLVAHTPCSY